MAQQPPPPQAFSNYGYIQQQAQFHQNGQQKTPNQYLVNGYPQQQQQLNPPNMPNQPPSQHQPQPIKPVPIPAQQIPPPQQQPQQTINYQNFQTNALQQQNQPPPLNSLPNQQHASGINGNNSAISSRTSSPGMQSNIIPPSQLPPSKSFPSYQPLIGQQQQNHQYPQNTGLMPPQAQQQVKPPSQTSPPMVPPVNNNNVGDSILPPLASHQNQLSASMKNLSIQNPVPTFPTAAAPAMPLSKSDQNLLNNNSNVQQQQTIKPSISMQKRPMYPQQQQQQTIPQSQYPSSIPPNPIAQQPHQFNTFPNVQQSQIQPNLQQNQQQPRGNLQYQNFQQQPQQQQPGGNNVVQQGFNRIWGRETVDLMQNRHILPQTKVLPPTVKLNHQFQEAVNCSSDIFRCTLTKIPESNSLLQKSRLPLGILIHPYRDLSVRLRTSLIINYYHFF